MRKILLRALICMVPSRRKRRALREKYLHKQGGATPSHLSLVQPPINIPPSHLVDDFTLKGAIPVLYWYFNNTVSIRHVTTREEYDAVFARFKDRTFQYYNNSMDFFYDALDKYPVKGKTVLVWGLAGCNLEAFSVWKGASRVYVVDYNKPDCRHESITVMTHDELRESGVRTDFAISFSSFEHDGLGRYGDPLNPSGDLEAMRETKRYLKPGGIMFFGVPLGQDHLVWNAHRIYGPTRLPRILEGWECLDAFGDCEKMTGGAFHTVFTAGDSIQPLLVLRVSGDGETRAMPVIVDGEYKTRNMTLLTDIGEILRKDVL